MTLSVVIPTHKRPALLSRLIDSLYRQDFERDRLQLIVVSNFKDKQLEKPLLKWRHWFYDFKLLATGEKGVNQARNLGLRFAFGDIVYFLDDDCLLNGSNHLKNIIDFHQKYKNSVGIGGGYITQGSFHSNKRFYLDQAGKWMKQSLKGGHLTSQLPGGNSSYKRAVFDRGFHYDSEIVFGGAEESFNRALCDNGYSLMLFNELDVIHNPPLSLPVLSKKAFLQGAGSFENRYKQGQSFRFLVDMSREGAFFVGSQDLEAFLYHFFFKIGYFWQASRRAKAFFLFRLLYFIGLVLKSRWAWVYHIVWKRCFGKVWWFFGKVWWFFGMYVWRPLVWLWYRFSMIKIYMWRIGYIIRMYVWQPLIWLCNDVWWWFFGRAWWFLGLYMWRPLVWLWYKSPFMKIYYFSKYQFRTRLLPFYKKRISKKNV